MHLSRSAPKQLNIALPKDLLVLLQGILGVLFTGEKHKGITGGSTVRVLDEQQTLGAVCNRALWTEEGQHLLGRGSEGQPSHPNDHLVLFGEELGHLVRRTWRHMTAMIQHMASSDHLMLLK